MKRRGIAAILAILFLAIFATMAVSYAAMTGMNVRKSGNYYHVLNSRLEAESGLAYLSYQLSKASVTSGLTGESLLSALATKLQAQLDGKACLNGSTVTYDGTTITVPSIATDAQGRSFYAQITCPNGDNTVHLMVVGTDATVQRSVGLDYALAKSSSPVFGYGIASKSAIQLTGNASIKGKNIAAEANILSTVTSTDEAYKLTGNCALQGDIYATNGDAYATLTGNVTIGGVSNSSSAISDHIHIGGDAVDFPEVDGSCFESYATTVVNSSTSTSGNKTFTNIRIKANTNPTFSGNIVFKGVVYIEQPNKVTFSGNTTITGVIVTEDAGDNAYTTNTLKFSGNVAVAGVENLNASDTANKFDKLSAMPGSFLLAPGFGVEFTGNFGTVSGTMAADSFKFTGNAGGTVKGSVINYSDSAFTMTGNSALVIDRNGMPSVPPGFALPVIFNASPDTYVEY